MLLGPGSSASVAGAPAPGTASPSQQKSEFEEKVLLFLENIDSRLCTVEAEQRIAVAHANKAQAAEAQKRKGRSAYQDLLEGHESINSASLNAIVQSLEASAARHELKRSATTMQLNMQHSDGNLLQQLARCTRNVALRAASCSCLVGRTINPLGRLRFRWQLLHIVVLQCAVILVPLRLAFPRAFSQEDVWIVVELAMDLLFCVDTLMNALTHYKKPFETQYVTDPPRVIQHYLLTWGVPDVVSSLPLAPALLLAGAPPDSRELVLARLLKLGRFAKLTVLLRELRSSKRAQKLLEAVDPALVLLGQLLMTIFLFWHWVACIWWFISSQTLHWTGESGASLDAEACVVGDELSCTARDRSPYVIAFHWAVTTSAGLGAPVRALTNAQSLCESATVCLGICIQSVVFGSVASAVGQIDESARMRKQKFEVIKNYVRLKNVTPHVRERVLDYYEFIYARIRPSEENALLEELPSRLRVELAITLNKPFIQKLELFSKASPGAIALIALLMVHQTHAPAEILLLTGQTNDSIFLIRSGRLTVYVQDTSGAAGKASDSVRDGESALANATPSSSQRVALSPGQLIEPPPSPPESLVKSAAKGGDGGCKVTFCGTTPPPSPPSITEEGPGVSSPFGGRSGSPEPGDTPPHKPFRRQRSVGFETPADKEAKEASVANSSGGAACANADPNCDLLAAVDAVNASMGGGGAGSSLPAVSKPPPESSHSTCAPSRFMRRTISQGAGHSTGPNGPATGAAGAGGGRFCNRSISRDLRQQAAATQQRFTSRITSRAASNQHQQHHAGSSGDPKSLEAKREQHEMQKKLDEMRAAANLDVSKLGKAVGRLSDGDTFGEQSFLTGEACTATVRTEAFCEVLSLRHGDLTVVFEAYPALREGIEQYAKKAFAIYQRKNQRAHTPHRERRSGSVRGVASLLTGAVSTALQSAKRHSITSGSFKVPSAHSDSRKSTAAAQGEEGGLSEESHRRWSICSNAVRRSSVKELQKRMAGEPPGATSTVLSRAGTSSSGGGSGSNQAGRLTA